MKVLIACEESGTITTLLRQHEIEAYSCDLLPTRGNPDYHYQQDLEQVITQGWDLIIAHPPCTALSLSGNRYYGSGMEKHEKRVTAIKWTVDLWEKIKQNSKYAALENPSSVIFQYLNAPVTWVQPWEHGHGEVKKTGFALHNLPKLIPSNIVSGRDPKVWLMPPSETRARDRSKTYPGIALAILNQWIPIIKGEKFASNQIDMFYELRDLQR